MSSHLNKLMCSTLGFVIYELEANNECPVSLVVKYILTIFDIIRAKCKLPQI